MKNHIYPLFLFLIFMGAQAFSQDPVITVRFSNPQFDCETQNYCLDVEFQSDTPDQQLFGMNVRFFYDDSLLEFIAFGDFQGGYGPVSPNPAERYTSELGPEIFTFSGAAEYIEGAVQLLNQAATPVVISTSGWTKLFNVCFSIDDPAAFDLESFCPSVVWDLNKDQAGTIIPNSGSQGVVITTVAPEPLQSKPSIENVVQFNWAYSDGGGQPFGAPVATQCISTVCQAEGPDISINKTASPLTYEAAGDVITYTIAVINTGTVPLTNVLIADPLTGLNAVIPNLVPGSAQLFTETYTITDADVLRGFVTNVATANGADPEGTIVSDSDEATVTLLPDEPTETELVLTKETNQSLVLPGEMVSFTIELTNIGEINALNVVLSDALSSNFIFISASNEGIYDPESHSVTWAIGDMEAEEVITVNLQVMVKEDVPSGVEISNQAFAYSDNSRPAASCVSKVIVIGESDLSIAKMANVQQAIPGEAITYTLVVTNNGPSPARNVIVVDNLPAELSFVSAQHGGVYFQESHKVEWVLGDMNQGETISIDLTLVLDPNTPDGRSIINFASVSSDTNDPNPLNNSTLHVLQVTGPRADLYVTKTAAEDKGRAGEHIEYSIMVSNDGPNGADQVVVTDTLPAHVTFVSANENGLYDQVSHSVTWQISYIMPGETFSLELVVRVNSETTLGTIITNRVDVMSITNDPDLANNTAFDEVEVIPTDLFIPDVFSPNNDGINDIFIIRGLDRYPNNSLIIINRWGNKVFEAAPYTNNWDGTNQFGITVGGDQLPVGTYYYILDLGESGSNQIRGFIYLTR